MDKDVAKGSRIIGRVLPAAVKLWLRSQVEQVDELSLALEGRDRDILSGYLPGVSVSAAQAVYRGIHIGQLQLSAQDIRVNIGQVLRGKPLRLLKVFPVLGEVSLTADGLNASLDSPLLDEGLRNFWRSLIQNPALAQTVQSRYGPLSIHQDMTLSSAKIRLGDQRLGLSFYPKVDDQQVDQPVMLGTGLSVISGNCLQLDSPHWLPSLASLNEMSECEPIDELQDFQWDLGSDTQLSDLVLQAEALLCKGQIIVNP